MIGTAFPAARILLIEQPGPWGTRGLRDSRCPPGVADAIHLRAQREGIRVQTIRRTGRTQADAGRAWAFAYTRESHESLRWATFSDPAELLEQPWDRVDDDDAPSGQVNENDPAYLVCAHSKHDACCALRGRPVAAALAAVRPGAVWETSHLGGDRFSANVLVLPSGVMYGRVLTFAVDDLVHAVDADDLLVPLMRGQVGHPPAVQAALAFAYDSLGLRRRRDLRAVGSTGLCDGIVTVTLQELSGPVSVEVEVTTVPAAGLTCANPGPNQYQQFRALGLTR